LSRGILSADRLRFPDVIYLRLRDVQMFRAENTLAAISAQPDFQPRFAHVTGLR
jgi:hypothetical protein